MKAYTKLHLTQTVHDIKNRKKQKLINKDNSLNAKMSLVEDGAVKGKEKTVISNYAIQLHNTLLQVMKYPNELGDFILSDKKYRLIKN